MKPAKHYNFKKPYLKPTFVAKVESPPVLITKFPGPTMPPVLPPMPMRPNLVPIPGITLDMITDKKKYLFDSLDYIENYFSDNIKWFELNHPDLVKEFNNALDNLAEVITNDKLKFDRMRDLDAVYDKIAIIKLKQEAKAAYEAAYAAYNWCLLEGVYNESLHNYYKQAEAVYSTICYDEKVAKDNAINEIIKEAELERLKVLEQKVKAEELAALRESEKVRKILKVGGIIFSSFFILAVCFYNYDTVVPFIKQQSYYLFSKIKEMRIIQKN